MLFDKHWFKRHYFIFGAWYSTATAATVSLFSDSLKSSVGIMEQVLKVPGLGKVGWKVICHVYMLA